MKLDDFETRTAFTAEEIEHILQLPMIEIVELLAKVPRTADRRFQGDACRVLVERLARGRIFADLIARQAVNAEPHIRRGPDSQESLCFALLDTTAGREFEVRFPGDLRNYLDAQRVSSDDQDVPG